MRRFILPVWCLALFLASCATIPSEFVSQVDPNLTLVDAKHAPDQWRGKVFLLGGTVNGRTDLPDGTRLRIHEHQVDVQSRPYREGPSEGDFWVMVRPPVNSAPYQVGQGVTLVGRLTGVEPAPGGPPLPSFDALYLRAWNPSDLPGSVGMDPRFHDANPSCQKVIGTGC